MDWREDDWTEFTKPPTSLRDRGRAQSSPEIRWLSSRPDTSLVRATSTARLVVHSCGTTG